MRCVVEDSTHPTGFPECNDYIAGLNDGERVMPTLRIDNETLVNPSDRELGRAIEAAASERE